ncbi:hypothetical protein FA09DRAFT_335706 [Tilletiopsis washingtonensis]|uniref:Uncharacterized protein n=1 Tax=Tilletiopsis washingtonensis TaxID=58919 RepID=A0A316ZKZ9_9BASI|nr:hypothetical protein FA09DRAFT_335706 [Tilletiopsis washingtonensis]PWO01066.1 hypothetical protein FA09DRAFT_335706 [Tilletiopsis washingtonensis]
MGVVFSCFAQSFMWLGELLENVFLAIGEIGSILVRGIFGLLIGLCDVLAALSCCCRVPWSERPDRTSYTYHTAASNVGGRQVFASLTPAGRAARKQQKAAAKKEHELRIESMRAERAAAAQQTSEKPAAAATVVAADVPVAVEQSAGPAAPAAQSSGWFGWLGGSPAAAAPAVAAKQ